MKKNLFIMIAIIAVIAVSCGKNADQASVPAPTGDGFYYTTFADGKIAAEANDKPIVIDFYTDW